MKTIRRIAFLMAVLAVSSVSVYAQDATQIAEKLKSMYPKTSFKEVKQSQIAGLYEVVMGENIAYTDASGRYFLFGHLFDMTEQVDITAARKVETKKVEFPSRYLNQAIKTVKGKGSRSVAIFTDPDCPYCKRLEKELVQLDDVTIYTFMYPLESLHPEAKTRAISVWCAPDRGKAWAALMMEGVTPTLRACNNPINDNLVLGSKLGVVGTPTLIAQDGRVLPGAASAEKINQWLGGDRQ